MQRKSILTSTFSFEKLIDSNSLYVDKTQYFYKLISESDNCYFCSRPRRFGKSLAISIFENIFLGRKELFEGLFIAGTDYDWEVFPVIHIDMARIGCISAENLFDGLMKCMKTHAEKYGVEIEAKAPWDYFDSLISALREKTGKRVVILIDEYDRPLTENIDKSDTLEEVRQVLESFYQIIKGQEPNERFVFMTGVTKFNKVSIFSKLNNLIDITMSREYACMFGYTQEELEKNFAPYIDDYVQDEKIDRAEFVAKIKKWYNGFKFHHKAETVYNPVSIGFFFKNDCEFRNYWFATATPTFITKLAKQQRLLREDIEQAKVSESSLNTFNIGDFARGGVSKATFIQLLLQTGYLTINKKIDTSVDLFLSLRFPNYEVENSFEQILFEVYSGMNSNDAITYVGNIIESANESKTDRLIELFQNFFSEVPYASCATSAQLNNFQLRKRSEATYTIQIPAEKYYQTIIFCIFKMCGMEIEAESATNKGRIDAVLTTPNSIYIFEFKIDQTAEIATEQILQKEYFQKFIEKANVDGKQIRCVGMNFSTTERNIIDWKIV